MLGGISCAIVFGTLLLIMCHIYLVFGTIVLMYAIIMIILVNKKLSGLKLKASKAFIIY